MSYSDLEKGTFHSNYNRVPTTNSSVAESLHEKLFQDWKKDIDTKFNNLSQNVSVAKNNVAEFTRDVFGQDAKRPSIENQIKTINLELSKLVASLQKPNVVIVDSKKLEIYNLKKVYDSKLQTLVQSIMDTTVKFNDIVQANRRPSVRSRATSGDNNQMQNDQTQLLAVDDALDELEIEIEERNDAIQQIAHDIIQINEMFRDLQLMVGDQQTLIDRIDLNIDNTVVHTETAVPILKDAEKYQKSSRKMQCILLAILIVVLIVLILSVVLSVS